MGAAPFSHRGSEDRVPVKCPQRRIRRVVKVALACLEAAFAALHVDFGHRLIAPDRPRTTDMSRKVVAAIPAHREVAPLLPHENSLLAFSGGRHAGQVPGL